MLLHFCVCHDDCHQEGFIGTYHWILDLLSTFYMLNVDPAFSIFMSMYVDEGEVVGKVLFIGTLSI